MNTHETHLRNLYRAISDGTTAAELSRFFHPAAEQLEYPSVMRPHGHRRGLAELLAGAEVGAHLIRDQHYEVHNVIVEGDHVAVQLTWTATVATELPGIKPGTPLIAHVSAFYVFRDGLVLRQSSYDCYEPLPQLTA